MSACETTASLIEPVIDHSLSLLPGRARAGDVPHGLLAALRRVRAALDDIGGYGLVSTLDAAIRDRLLIRRLRSRRAGELPVVGRLPAASPGAILAETVMVSAAETCLIYAAGEPDIGGVMLVVFVLLDRLIEALGEAPDYDELAGWLRQGEEAVQAASDAGAEALPDSVH